MNTTENLELKNFNFLHQIYKMAYKAITLKKLVAYDEQYSVIASILYLAMLFFINIVICQLFSKKHFKISLLLIFDSTKPSNIFKSIISLLSFFISILASSTITRKILSSNSYAYPLAVTAYSMTHIPFLHFISEFNILWFKIDIAKYMTCLNFCFDSILILVSFHLITISMRKQLEILGRTNGVVYLMIYLFLSISNERSFTVSVINLCE